MSNTYIQPETMVYRNEQDQIVFSQQDSLGNKTAAD